MRTPRPVFGKELKIGDTFTTGLLGSKEYIIKAFAPYTNPDHPEFECGGTSRVASFANQKHSMTILGDQILYLVD